MLTRLCIVILAFISISSHANAALVVDTGPGSQNIGGLGLAPGQWLAGQFSLSEMHRINSVEGWFGENTEGTITSTIYTDNGSGVPISVLFSEQFFLDSPVASTSNAWDGAYGLDWSLDPGTYWLAFEVRTGDTGRGYMTYLNEGAPNPLDDYAFKPIGPNWSSASSTFALGMRIDATIPAVPVPAAVWLFGTALIGLVGFSKRRKAD